MLAAAIGVGIAAAFILHSSAWSFLCDDAFISFRYAENLASGGGLVFNPGVQPPEYVEGYTNFGWVVLLALPSALGIRPHIAAPMFTTLAAAAGLLLAAVLLKALRRSPGRTLAGTDLVAPALLVAAPEYIVWSHGGLETAAATALVLGAMVAWVRGRLRLAAAVAAAAGLTRPDALLPIAVFGLAWAAVYAGPAVLRDRARTLATVPWRDVAVAAAIFVLPLAAHLLFRRAYYGSWLPNTWTIKAHGNLLRPTYGRAYVEAWAAGVRLLWLAPMALLLRPRHVIVVAPIGAIVFYGWWVGGDFMAYSRFYMVATALLAVLVGWLLSDAAQLLRRVHPGAATLAPVVAAAALAAALGRDARDRRALDEARGGKWLDGKWEGITAMDGFAEVGFAAGTWMHDHLPGDTWITVGAAGAVPYGARLPTIDAYGLVDPVIATLPDAGPKKKRARPGHQLMAPKHYIDARDPDLLCHVGYRGTTRPRHVPRSYGRGYAWACMQPEPVGERDPGFYCCRRPQRRVVGPFGARGGSG